MNPYAPLGFLIAPAVTGFCIYGAFLLMGNDTPESELGAAFWAKILTLFSYLATACLGVPLYVFFERKGIDSLKAYVVTGAMSGFLAGLFFAPPSSEKLSLALIGMACGGLTVSVLWLLVVAMDPRRKAPRDSA